MTRQWFSTVKYMLLLVSILSFLGCAQRQPQKVQSAKILWKSPSIRYADMGFISDNKHTLQVEIYGSGSALMRLKIDTHSICMSTFECMSKERFNQTLLSPYYPTDTLENIFRGKPIFGGMALTKKRNGFTQTIQKAQIYNINYTILNNQITFSDTINQIVIKVTKL